MNRKKLAVIVLTALLLSVMRAQDITTTNLQATRAVVVSVTQAWTSTNISLLAGDKIDISVRGVASTDGATTPQSTKWIGPDGNGGLYPSSPLPTAAQHSVIGRLGSSGSLFFVGSSVSFTVNSNITSASTLYLGYNDYGLSDNFGYYVAFITVVRNGTLLTNVVSMDEQLPGKFALSQNYPNPFNPSTTIEYQLSQRDNVEIRVYNVAGELVKKLLDTEMSAGVHSVAWDGRDDVGQSVSTGTYFYQVKSGNILQAKKMLLLK
ncbi:MAG: T9SS type A sorting domain-containing protein [Ignavibacteriales bacterium]|nr:T9SS type A sorting domain-containing protein [Ignavibacteriales bacterium]